MKINLQALTGNARMIEDRYREIYGEGDYKERIAALRKKNLKRYVLMVCLMLLLIIYGVLSGSEASPKVEIKDGRLISVQRPQEGKEPVFLDAKVWASAEDIRIGQEKRIIIAPQNTGKSEGNILQEESESAKLERRIGTVARSLNQDTSSDRILLPTELEDGTKLTWQQSERSSSPIFLVIFACAALLVYKGRYDGITAEEKSAKASIVRELPEFINKLVLLLCSGIVLQVAIEKIIADDEKLRKGEKAYFYDQMRIISQKSKETNASMHLEFYRFARRSKVRELMRVAGILADSVEKGSDVVGKLQRESEMLWFARKKQSEEMGRLAETKMTLPLAILLLVLVMITIAPALLGM